jgi:hypothetical protein
MQMLYNSDSFVVVKFDLPTAVPPEAPTARGGYEIVDKHARRGIYIEGALAERFQQGVQDLVAGDPSEDDFDDFFGGYCVLAQQPVTLH